MNAPTILHIYLQSLHISKCFNVIGVVLFISCNENVQAYTYIEAYLSGPLLVVDECPWCMYVCLFSGVCNAVSIQYGITLQT